LKNISKNIVTLLIVTFFVTACISATTPTTTNKDIVTVENTSTPTTLPTATLPPTATPTPAPTDHPGWMPEGAIARFGRGGYGGMAVSPDNSIVAVAGTSGVHFINPLTGHTVDFLETGTDPFDVTFSPDGQKLFISLGDNGVAIWNHDTTGSWTQAEIFPIPCAVNLDISPNGEILFTKCFSAKNNKFIAWELATKKQLYQINYAANNISFAMAISPTHPDIMAVAANQTVTFMEVKSGRTISTYYEPNKSKVIDLDFSPDGTLLAIASESTEAVLLNVETAEEFGRITHNANTKQISFINKNTIAASTEDSFIVEDIDGKVQKSFDDWNSGHIYVPEHNTIVIGKGGSITTLSLDTYQIIGEVNGFNLYSKYEASISGNGNSFIVEDVLIQTNDPANFIHFDLHRICDDPRPPTQFIDSDGKYIYFPCGENKFIVAELATMKEVMSFDRPLRLPLSTNSQRHPWVDDRTLLALMYKNSESSPVKYRIEIWDPIQDKKVSTLNVDIPEFQTQGTPNLAISPHSKYLVVMPSDGKSILSYDAASGALVQNIKLNTPRPLDKLLNEGVFLDGDATFFIRHANFVEAYSIESGALIQKISGLQLVKGNTCETFCPGDKNNFAYFDKTKTFVGYDVKTDKDNINLSFISYNLISGQKTSVNSVQLPYKLQSGEKVDRAKQALSIKLIYMPPENNGNTAIVAATLSHVGSNTRDSTIYVVDIPTNTILKSYTWQHSAWNISFLAFNNFLLARQSPTPLYFLWDISTP
jgi:WD40 repeat protein